jgi:hypothetical protein
MHWHYRKKSFKVLLYNKLTNESFYQSGILYYLLLRFLENDEYLLCDLYKE